MIELRGTHKKSFFFYFKYLVPEIPLLGIWP